MILFDIVFPYLEMSDRGRGGGGGGLRTSCVVPRGFQKMCKLSIRHISRLGFSRLK